MSYSAQHIVFFDGVCGLCNKSVDFLIRSDRKHVLKFATLQGSKAKQLIPQHTEILSTIVYYENGKTFVKSDAALRAFIAIGGWRKITTIAFVVPRVIRNFVYDYVSNRRYKWFGRRSECRIPSPEERAYFHD